MDSEVQGGANLVVYRSMVRNLVACAEFEQWCQTLNLVPASEEVDEWEHRQSHSRINAVQSIQTEMAEVAALAGLVAHGLFDGACEDGSHSELYQHIAVAAVQAAVIRLVDQGKLKVVS